MKAMLESVSLHLCYNILNLFQFFASKGGLAGYPIDPLNSQPLTTLVSHLQKNPQNLVIIKDLFEATTILHDEVHASV